MPVGHLEELLILAKTYPNPSASHREITCVAAINKNREFRRLFPLPYRYLQGDQKFSKWQWITARIHKASKDHRTESHTIDRDSIVPDAIIPTSNGWNRRLEWINDHLYSSPEILEKHRQEKGASFGFIQPTRLLELEISDSDQPDWTEEEKQKLVHQDGLFDSKEARDKIMLRKLPHDFYYRYECKDEKGIITTWKHKITDWEAGALYWNCQRSHGKNWEKPFREKLEIEFKNKNILFLLGTMHRFPDQWLIVAFYYPPKPDISQARQLDLLM